MSPSLTSYAGSMPLIVEFDSTLPSVDPTAWVAPNATLIGAVTLAANASVYYGSVLRGDTDAIVVGEGSNIQDNVSMHTDRGLVLTIGSGVSVGHGAVLHGCTVEDDCLIGMSATVLNRAVVGAGSLVAAGAVVLENAVIPPGSLVAGVPARVVRSLTDEEKQGLVANAQRYLEYTAAHREAN
jgi:carbonic anhydrase/acetyltransferase-like protein (isoleucine patch superfamily)